MTLLAVSSVFCLRSKDGINKIWFAISLKYTHVSRKPNVSQDMFALTKSFAGTIVPLVVAVAMTVASGTKLCAAPLPHKRITYPEFGTTQLWYVYKIRGIVHSEEYNCTVFYRNSPVITVAPECHGCTRHYFQTRWCSGPWSQRRSPSPDIGWRNATYIVVNCILGVWHVKQRMSRHFKRIECQGQIPKEPESFSCLAPKGP